MSNLEKNINSECKRLENRKELLNKKIQKLLEHIKIAYNDKLELKINDEVFVDIKEQKEREIEQCRKQVYDIEKKIEIEKSKHTISYNQIKKLSEDFLNTDKITKQVLEKLIDRIEFDSNRNINLKLVFSNIKNENRYP